MAHALITNRLIHKFELFFFFLTLLLLPTQLGKHFWPGFAYIYSIKTDYFSPTIYFWDILVVFLLSCFILNKGRFQRNALSILLLFLFTQVISLLWSINLGASLVRLEQFLIIGFWGLYVGSKRFEEIQGILGVGVGLAVIWSSLLGLLELILGRSVGLWVLGERSFYLTTMGIATFNWYGQVFLRAYATFPHPNVLAAFLLIGTVLVEWLKPPFTKGWRLFYVGTLFCGSMGIFITFSRVGIASFSLFFVYLLRKQLRLLLGLIFFALPFLYVRFQSAFNFDQLSIIRREELAGQAFVLWQSHPFLGVGLNNFIFELAKGDIISGEVRFLQPVHNIILLALSETGLIGAIGLVGLIGTGIYRGLINRNKFLVYCWVCILGFGMLDHFLLTLAQGLRVLFLVWGISVIHLSGENRKDDF